MREIEQKSDWSIVSEDKIQSIREKNFIKKKNLLKMKEDYFYRTGLKKYFYGHMEYVLLQIEVIISLGVTRNWNPNKQSYGKPNWQFSLI